MAVFFVHLVLFCNRRFRQDECIGKHSRVRFSFGFWCTRPIRLKNEPRIRITGRQVKAWNWLANLRTCLESSAHLRNRRHANSVLKGHRKKGKRPARVGGTRARKPASRAVVGRRQSFSAPADFRRRIVGKMRRRPMGLYVTQCAWGRVLLHGAKDYSGPMARIGFFY